MDVIDLPGRARKVLLELEDLNSREHKYWNVARSTAIFLYGLCRLIGARKVVEIGTSTGYSTIYLGLAVGSEGQVVTVESHGGRFEMAGHYLAEAGVTDVVKQIEGHAPEVFLEENVLEQEFVDLLFLDATKCEYKQYFDELSVFVRAGGFIVADNCVSHAEEMRDFLNEVRGRGELESFLLRMDSGLMIIRKRGIAAGGTPSVLLS